MKNVFGFLVVYSAAIGVICLWGWWPSRPGVPDAQPGQVWRSKWNGSLVKVESVELGDGGGQFVTLAHWHAEKWIGAPAGWGIGQTYLLNQSAWRRHIRQERRVLS